MGILPSPVLESCGDRRSRITLPPKGQSGGFCSVVVRLSGDDTHLCSHSPCIKGGRRVEHSPKALRFFSFFLCVCISLCYLCKLYARGVVRVGESLNLVTRSGVHGEGPTLMMSTPARQQIGLKILSVTGFSGVILSHGIAAIGP